MQILGVKVSNVSWSEALEQTASFLHDNHQHLITSPNPEMVVLAQEDKKYLAALNQADLAIPDGMGIYLASILLGEKLKKRIPGVDFVWQLAELAEKTGKSIYLLGGQKGVNLLAAKELSKRFPHLKIYCGGDNLPPGSAVIKEDIKLKEPNILLIAFGHGKQEKWAVENLPDLPSVDIAMGVGGAFDFIAGRVQRAPTWMRKLGLEWLWRLVREPWRWRRILTATCKFSWLVIKFKMQKSK